MRKFQQIVYSLVFIFVSTAIIHGTELQEGFLGTKWGTNISELTGFSKVTKKGDVSYYRNPQKSYTVFGVDTADVIFGFFKDKFFAAYIAVESIEVFDRAKDRLTQQFGSPKTILKTKNRQTIFSWKQADTRIKLKLNEKEGKMKLAFYSTPIAGEVNQVQRDMFPQIAVEDFGIDSRSRQQAIDDRRLRQSIDVMGF
ncbi:MAG: hypothetical protein PVH85_11190 [Desulfobacterales bacterium]